MLISLVLLIIIGFGIYEIFNIEKKIVMKKIHKNRRHLKFLYQAELYIKIGITNIK